MKIGDLMTLTEKSVKSCGCTGVCTGYATRTECPPLIVIAIAIATQEFAITI